VYYDGEVIFSKLEEKRLPNIPEIIRSLDVAKLERASPRGGGGAVEPEAISDVERNPF
jgi:hypothetical protein